MFVIIFYIPFRRYIIFCKVTDYKINTKKIASFFLRTHSRKQYKSKKLTLLLTIREKRVKFADYNINKKN